jgi:hypothetical protein
MRYLVINEQGYVENIIIWDGVTRYSPRNKTLLLESNAPTGTTFGWQLVNGEWIPVPVVEETEQEI